MTLSDPPPLTGFQGHDIFQSRLSQKQQVNRKVTIAH